MTTAARGLDAARLPAGGGPQAMRVDRRRVLALAGAAAAGPCLGDAGHGQGARLALTRLVVPSTPGSVSYKVAHALQQAWPIHAEHPLAIVERAGAAGTLALQALAHGPTDGSLVLLAHTGTHVVRPEVTHGGQLKTLRPVAKLASAPGVLVCTAALSVTSLAGMVQLARQRRGELTFASAGIASLGHLVMEAISRQSGIALMHVPYKSAAESLSDLLAARVQLNIMGVDAALPHLRSGRLRALAFSGHLRSADLPGVPTFGELGIEGADIESWQGLFVSSGATAATVRRLTSIAAAILEDAAFRQALHAQSLDAAAPGHVEGFEKLIDLQHRQVRALLLAQRLRLV